LAIQPGLIFQDIFYFGVGFLLLAYTLHKYHPTLLFNPFIRFVGNISYTLYLTHWAAIYFLIKLNLVNPIATTNEFFAVGDFIINYALVLLTSVALSTVLYYTIELPMQDFGKKIIKLIG
jgi:peptidoglycan/LPS O-acetylase OafA/YrhL